MLFQRWPDVDDIAPGHGRAVEDGVLAHWVRNRETRFFVPLL